MYGKDVLLCRFDMRIGQEMASPARAIAHDETTMRNRPKNRADLGALGSLFSSARQAFQREVPGSSFPHRLRRPYFRSMLKPAVRLDSLLRAGQTLKATSPMMGRGAPARLVA
jgi:hypothetical protein